MPRRLVCYASGAMRGIYYAGVMRALAEASIEFSDFAGISVGANAAAWHAAGQTSDALEAWDALTFAKLSLHPVFNSPTSKNLDWLIENISLPFLDTDAIKTSGHTLHVAVSAINPLRQWLCARCTRAYLRFQHDFTREALCTAIRASSYMPFINGITASLAINGKRYLDGGLTGRIPLDCTDLSAFDEVWLSVASPRALAELALFQLDRQDRPRIILIAPSRPVPISRMTIDKTRFHDTATLGYYDAIRVIRKVRAD